MRKGVIHLSGRNGQLAPNGGKRKAISLDGETKENGERESLWLVLRENERNEHKIEKLIRKYVIVWITQKGKVC